MTLPRALSEPAARELAEQLKALVTGAPAASFLAANPPGSVYRETTGINPGARFGGTWRSLPSLGGYAWERTDDGTGDDGSTAQFLAAHPVGTIYEETTGINPGATRGGAWRSLPSLGGHKWERTA